MASYLQSTQDFLYRRRRPLLFLGGLVGGVYVAANYAVTKLGDMQRRMVEERRDRENIRRRFQQNQDDCTFTILALLPTLGDQVFAYTDVEGLTSRLQKGRAVSANRARPSLEEKATDDATGGENKLNGSIAPDQVPSATGMTTAGELAASSSTVPESAAMEEVWAKFGKGDTNGPVTSDKVADEGSWMKGEDVDTSLETSNTSADAETAIDQKTNGHRIAPSSKLISGLDAVAEPAPLPIPPEARLSPSPVPSPFAQNVTHLGVGAIQENGRDGTDVQPTSKSLPNGIPLGRSDTADASGSAHRVDAEEEKRAKLSLWNELKIAAFTRTITTLYGIVLLSMQTHVQLNLLGRYAYLTSVSTISTSETPGNDPTSENHQIRLERHDNNGYLDDDAGSIDYRMNGFEDEEKVRHRSADNSKDSDILRDGIDVQTERLYLTLSWWFLHRGWKLLADIVQDAVHDVFGDVALKTPLTHAQLAAMMRKVRRRVEYEGVRNENAPYGQLSFASLDARSEFSEATTAATNRRRGKRRNFSTILFPPAGLELQTLYDANALGPAWSQSNLDQASLSSLSSTLPSLLDETRDIVDSSDFWRITKLGLQNVFSIFEDSLRPSFGLGPALRMQGEAVTRSDNTSTASIMELPADGSLDSGEGRSVRLASLFPAVARQSTAAIHGVPNEYVEALGSVKELRAFCAVIYSAWS